MELEQIKCKKCKNDMPKLRLDSYGYDFCVSCSTVSPKVGRIRVIGEGDYTVTELDILDQDTAKRLQELENTSRGVRNVPLEVINFDEDEPFHNLAAIESTVEVCREDDLDMEEIDDEEDLADEDLELEDEED